MRYELIKERNPQLSLLQQVLTNRGIRDVDHYLHTSDADILNPCLFPNMNKGVKLFIEEQRKNSKTLLLVDSDVDGITSSAIIYNYVHRLWPNWDWKYFLHSEKQHGLNDCVNYIIDKEFEFVIVPDAGSNDFEELKLLASKGIKVLCLDHHECSQETQDAIVINNQMCDYPTKSLSGAGVVYKFCQRLDEVFSNNIADDFLDLAAVGICADMMPLTDYETHRIIEKGLNNVQNPFLMAMMEKNEFYLKGHVNPRGVSFYIAPTMNAVMRVGTLEERTLLFEGLLEDHASQLVPSGKRGAKGEMVSLVDEAVRQASNVKSRQSKAQENKVKDIITLIDEQQLNNNKMLIICQNQDLEGMTGLIANKLMAQYKKPVLLLQKGTNPEGKTIYSGSARNIPYGPIDDLRSFLESTGLVLYAQGHKSALGTSLLADNIDAFIDTINYQLRDADFSSAYKVDDIIASTKLNKDDIVSLYGARDLWGQDISEPYIAVTGVKVGPTDVFINEKILKITDMSKGIYYTKFKPTPEELMFFSSLGKTRTLDIVGTCSYSDYDKAPVINITDYNVSKDSYWDF